MLLAFLHASVLICCAAAAVAALRESWRPAPQAGRWAGRLTVAASILVVLDWALLLARDWHLTDPAAVAVTVLDSFVIVLGVAWIPCFFLLKIKRPALRAASYISACLLALFWIGRHIPTHAIPPQVGSDTAAMHVGVALIGFAFLNLTLIVLPSRRSAAAGNPVRLAWGTAAAACIATVVVGVSG